MLAVKIFLVHFRGKILFEAVSCSHSLGPLKKKLDRLAGITWAPLLIQKKLLTGVLSELSNDNNH